MSRIGVLEAVQLARAAGVRDGLLAEITAQTGTLSEQSAVWLDIYEARRLGSVDATSEANMLVASDLLAKDLRHAVTLGAEFGLDLTASALAAAAGDAIYLVRDHAPRIGPVETNP